MQIATVGAYPVTIGWLIAILVLLLAVLGLLGVIPTSPMVVFGLIAALAVARLT
jgi:hypothetical protein